MSNELKELEDILKITFSKDLVKEVRKVEEGHFDILTTTDKAYDLMKILTEDAGIYHLSTVTAVEREKEFNVFYHIQHRIEEEFREVSINFIVTGINKDKPKTPSLLDFFVAADYYERECYDFFGIYFENHPFMQRLILPEKWPDDVRPMLKEYGWEELKEITLGIAKQISEND